MKNVKKKIKLLRATFWESQTKSGNLRKWPSSNLLIACILFKIHVLKKKQKTDLKNIFKYLRFWPLNIWCFVKDLIVSYILQLWSLIIDNNKEKTLIFLFGLVPWMDHRKKKTKKNMCHIWRLEILPSKIPLKPLFVNI